MSLEVKTKESQTVDGAVEYEAVECQHCERDVPVDNTVVTYKPTRAEKRSPTVGRSHIRVYYAADGGQTAFCPDCYRSIFGEAPSPNYLRQLQEHCREREWVLLVTMALSGVVLLLAITGFFALFHGVMG